MEMRKIIGKRSFIDIFFKNRKKFWEFIITINKQYLKLIKIVFIKTLIYLFKGFKTNSK